MLDQVNTFHVRLVQVTLSGLIFGDIISSYVK